MSTQISGERIKLDYWANEPSGVVKKAFNFSNKKRPAKNRWAFFIKPRQEAALVFEVAF